MRASTKLLVLVFFAVSLGRVRNPFEGNLYPYDPVVQWGDGYYAFCGFSKPMLGVGGALHSASLAFFSPHVCWGGWGLRINHVGNAYYNHQRLWIIYKTPRLCLDRFMRFYAWFAPGVERCGLLRGNFHRFDRSDPILGAGDRFAPSFSGGVVAQMRRAILAVWGEDIYGADLSAGGGFRQPASAEGYVGFGVWRGVSAWLGARYDGVAKRLLPSFGVTYRSKGWRFWAGYARSSAWISVSAPVVLGRVWSGYRAAYHLATPDVARAALTSHAAELELALPTKVRRIPRLPNFTLDPGEMPDIAPSDTVYLSVAVLNRSEAPAGSTKTSLFAVTEGETTLIALVDVPPLAPGEDFLAQFTWVPPHPGSYRLVFTADDDGKHFPGIGSIVDESNEEDNRLVHELLVFGEVVASVSPLLQVLSIPTVTFVREEEPIVPLVFFDPKSAQPPPRFDSTLAVVAERLLSNPDVVLELRGYYDPITDGDSVELALMRADAVRDRLVRLGVPPSSVVVLGEDEYDPSRPRVPLTRADIPRRDLYMICAENRRVEMVARFENMPYLLYEFELPPRAPLSQRQRSVLDTLAEKLAGVLCSNHSAIVLLEGVPAPGDDPVDVLRRLDAVRSYLLPRMQVFCPLERIPIALSEGKVGRTTARLWLSAEAIIFKPIENAEAAKEFKIPDDVGRNLIVIAVSHPEHITRYSIFAVNEDTGDTVRVFARGDGPPPSQVVWDWRDGNGNLIDPRGTYRVYVSLQDYLGRNYVVKSDPIWVVVEKWEHRIESSIVVQFAFDEATSESKYLESRLEDFARQIVDKAAIPGNEITVCLTGHTDVIGTARRNQKLSEQRAQKELRNLRYLLQFVLGLDTPDELDRWLSEHNVRLVARGVRDLEPYVIERYRNGRFEKVLLGDDTKPEGRSVNRRVVIEVEEKIQK